MLLKFFLQSEDEEEEEKQFYSSLFLRGFFLHFHFHSSMLVVFQINKLSQKGQHMASALCLVAPHFTTLGRATSLGLARVALRDVTTVFLQTHEQACQHMPVSRASEPSARHHRSPSPSPSFWVPRSGSTATCLRSNALRIEGTSNRPS